MRLAVFFGNSLGEIVAKPTVRPSLTLTSTLNGTIVYSLAARNRIRFTGGHKFQAAEFSMSVRVP